MTNARATPTSISCGQSRLVTLLVMAALVLGLLAPGLPVTATTPSAPPAQPASPTATPSPALGVLSASTSDAIATRTLLGPLADDPYCCDNTTVNDVVAGPNGFLAVGSTPRGAVVWTSPDGTDWERVPDAPVFDGASINDVTAGGPGFVAVGWVRGCGGCEGMIATAWMSTDGRVWQRSGRGQALRPAGGARWENEMLAVTRLADGAVVAVGGEWDPYGSGEAMFVAWSSTDGQHWRRLGPRRLEGRAGGDVVAFRDGWVAVGEGRVRVSRDGRTWRTLRPPVQFGRIAARGDLLVATTDLGWSTSDDPPSGETLESVWTSSDGMAWRRAEPPVKRPWGPYDLTASATRFVLMGDTGESGAVWTSADGSTWEQTTVPLMGTPDVSRPASLAATEGQIVIVGNVPIPDQSEVPVAWSLPPTPAAHVDRPAPTRTPWVEPQIVAWSAVDGLTVPPSAAIASLPSGEVMIAGGFAGEDQNESPIWIRRVTMFDPRTGTSRRIARLPAAMGDGFGIADPQGRVYLLPGYGVTRRILRWSPRAGRWKSVGPKLAGPGRAVWLADGRLLISGATEVNFLQAWDPRTGSVTRVASRGPDMVTTAHGVTLAFTRSRAWRYDPSGRWHPGAANPHLVEGDPLVPFALSDGRVAVLIHGVHGPPCPDPSADPEEDVTELLGAEFTLIDIYDTDADVWRSGLAIPDQRSQVTAVGLPGDRILVVSSADGSLPVDCVWPDTPSSPGVIVVDLPPTR